MAQIMVSYEEENDILSIHKGFANGERFKGNIDVGDLILDMSTKGRVRGIEILNASSFLKEFRIGKEILRTISSAELNAQVGANSIILGLVLKTKDREIPAKIAVPIAL